MHGQEYFNRIIPFEFGNPNPAQLLVKDKDYLIPVIYPDSASSIIRYSKDHEIDYFHVSNFDFCRSSLSIIDDGLYSFAKDRSKAKALKLGKFNDGFEFDWKVDIDTEGEYNFATNSIALSGHVYSSYFMEYDGGAVRQIGLTKHSTGGTEIWNEIYNEDIELSYPWVIRPSMDNHILLSAGVHYFDSFGRYSQITKIDTSGEVVWKFEGDEAFEHGATPGWIAELSDSNIVQSYRIDRSADPEFIANDWYGYPTRLLWLNSNGQQINEQLIIHDAHHELTLSNLISGKGDYFFAIGRFVLPDWEYYGSITKYSNDGDVIWSRLYRHPDFNEIDNFHYIRDLVEFDNGDLAFVGTISPLSGTTDIWLMRVNSDGCLGLGTNLCGDVVIGNSTSTKEKSDKTISIFPNPTTGYCKIAGLDNEQVSLLNIYNTLGHLVHTERQPDLDNINISSLQSGIYFVNVHFENTSIEGVRLVKY